MFKNSNFIFFVYNSKRIYTRKLNICSFRELDKNTILNVY